MTVLHNTAEISSPGAEAFRSTQAVQRGADPTETDRLAPSADVFSIFHEPWFLDVATERCWTEARVVQDGVALARFPYAHRVYAGMTVSWVPSLIRTLGPAIRPLPGKSATALRRRLEITHQLIDQLPRFDYFEQYFDPRIQDALAFIQRGFRVCHAYSFKTPEGQAATAIWSGMVDKTRNLVRKAEEKFHIAPIGDVEEFCRFYESNLDGQSNRHGSRRLRTLLRAVQVRNAGVLLGAWTREGVLCAAVGLVWDSHAVYYLLSTRHQQLADSGTVALLIWRGMQIACSRNMAFELDGVTSPAVFQFLSGFGASLVPRLRVQRITRRFRLTQAILSKLGRSLDAVVAEGKRAGMLCLVAVSQLCPGDIGWIF